MDREGEGILHNEYCFLDVKHNRCAGFKTFSVHVYHPMLRSQFHFKQSVNRHANQLNSSRSKVELKKLSNDLMQATTPSLYEKCQKALKDFICKKPNRRNFLTTWLEWWHYRRFHIFKAFRATDNTPTTNLAEAVHAAWKCMQATNITLVDAAYHDIAESIHIERQLEQYKSGLYQGGSGPSAYSRQQQNYQSQKKRAEQYSAELLKDSTCSHRPTKRKKTTKGNSTAKRSRLSAHYQMQTELSSSSSEECVQSPPPPHNVKGKRNFRYRSQRSKSFELSLEKAKKLKSTIVLTQTIDLCDEMVYCVTRQCQNRKQSLMFMSIRSEEKFNL